MFFQSCTVYKLTLISIEQVVENQFEVKIHTLNNDTYKFTAIETRDRKYFGINKSGNMVIRAPIDENQIDTIKEKKQNVINYFKDWNSTCLYGSRLFICLLWCGNLKSNQLISNK